MSRTLAELLWLLGTLVILIVRLPPLLRARKEGVRTAGQERYRLLAALYVGGTVVIPGLYVLTGIPRSADYPFATALGWAGAAAAVAGLWLFYRAHADLGRQWSSSLEIRYQHRLVATGVYARVRHPMYSALLLWCVGQALLLPNWVAGPAGLAAFSVFLLLRIPREEELMVREFGEDYRAYMSRTQRLVPWLW